MFNKQKIVAALNKEIPESISILVIVLCGLLAGIFLIYQYLKV